VISFFNHIGYLWAEYFGIAVVQNTIFLGIICLFLHILRNGSARLKYTVTIIGLTKLLLPPFIPATFLSGVSKSSTLYFGIASPISTTTTPTPTPEILNTIGVLFLLWIIFSSSALLFPLFSTVKLKWKLWDADLIHVNSGVKIYKSKKVNMPLTLGIFPKKIFVPVNWDNWSSECQEMIIDHELTHIRRRDGIVQLLQIFTRAIYFFHPLVWFLNRKINEYREMDCDDVSTTRGKYSSEEYSEHLVEIAENLVQNQLSYLPVSALIKKKNELLKRVHYQLKEKTMKQISKKRIGILFSVLILTFFSLSLNTCNPDTENIETTFEPPSTSVEIPSSPQKTGKIYGNVENGETGEPLQEAFIGVSYSIEDIEIGRGVGSDRDGNYFISNLPPRVYTLWSTHPGFDTTKINLVKVQAGKSTNINIVLNPTDIPLPPKVPPPPPPEGAPPVRFVAYDEPPIPIGGYEAVKKNVVYPDEAKKNGFEGTVVLQIFIDETGTVSHAIVLKGVPNTGLDEAAIDAIKKTRFSPAKHEDIPVGVWIAVPINFTLPEK